MQHFPRFQRPSFRRDFEKSHIARERQVIEKAIQKGRDTDISESMLHAMEDGLRAVERHRRLILDQLGAD